VTVSLLALLTALAVRGHLAADCVYAATAAG